MSDLFTFIVPVLNGEASLKACLDSLLRQTYQNCEVIVVDNGSTDKTKEIALSYPSVRYVYTEIKNRSHARNLGSTKAAGKYLCFVDCDVVLSIDWLEKCDFYLQKNPIDFLGTQMIPKIKSGAIVDEYRYFFAEWKSHSTFLSVCKRLALFPVINTAGCVVRLDSFELVGKFNESLQRNEDLELSIRFFCQGYILGALSFASGSVSFCEEHSSFVRGLLYFKRCFVVNYNNFFKSLGLYKFNSKLIRDIFYSSHSQRFLLLSFAVICECMSWCGSLASFIYPKNSFDFSSLVLRRGKKTLLGSCVHQGGVYILRDEINFLYVDQDIYISENVLNFQLKKMSAGEVSLLKKIFHQQDLSENEAMVLASSKWFERYLLTV